MTNNSERTIPSARWENINKMFPLEINPVMVERKLVDPSTNETVVIQQHTGAYNKIDHLQLAAEDGRLLKIVEDNATALHDSNVVSSCNSMINNISSILNKRKLVADENRSDAWKHELERIIWLREQLNVYKQSASGKLADRPIKTERPQWAYGPAELDLINDPEQLRKTINSISDACSEQKLSNFKDVAKWLGSDPIEQAKFNREYAQKRLTNLRKQATANTVTATVLSTVADKATVRKTSKGEKVFTLSMEELQELAKAIAAAALDSKK